MAAIGWLKENACRFINNYEEYESLWNTKNKEYKNRHTTRAAFRKVIEEMKELGLTMT